MTQTATEVLAPEVFDEAYRRVVPLVHSTLFLHSTSLSNETGYDVWLKAEIFQRTGSYKLRGRATCCRSCRGKSSGQASSAPRRATTRRVSRTRPCDSGFPRPSGRVEAKPGSKVVCVLSGGNLDLQHLCAAAS